MSVQLIKSNLSLYQQKHSLEDAYSKFQKDSAVDMCYLSSGILCSVQW
jgi:hypothetical protein